MVLEGPLQEDDKAAESTGLVEVEEPSMEEVELE